MQQSHLDMQKSMTEKIQQAQENLQQYPLKEIDKIGGKRVERDQGKVILVDGSSSSSKRQVRGMMRPLVIG